MRRIDSPNGGFQAAHNAFRRCTTNWLPTRAHRRRCCRSWDGSMIDVHRSWRPTGQRLQTSWPSCLREQSFHAATALSSHSSCRSTLRSRSWTVRCRPWRRDGARRWSLPRCPDRGTGRRLRCPRRSSVVRRRRRARGGRCPPRCRVPAGAIARLTPPGAPGTPQRASGWCCVGPRRDPGGIGTDRGYVRHDRRRTLPLCQRHHPFGDGQPGSSRKDGAPCGAASCRAALCLPWPRP